MTAIPYYAWDHREPGAMIVWVRQDGKSREPQRNEPGWDGRLYRALDPGTLGPSQPLDLSDLLSPSASHCWSNDNVMAVADRREPENSHDQSLPRMTWWDHRGTAEWVQYDLGQPMTVRATEVYWFDDEPGGGCRIPASWKLLYRTGDKWQEVPQASGYGTTKDQFNRTTFDPITTTGLRMEVQLQPGFSGGILEWKVE